MQHVEVKIHENVATILLDRPAVRNALNPRFIEDVMMALSDVHQEKRVGAVVLTSSGDHFCAGLDMNLFAEITQLPDDQSMTQWFTLWKNWTRLLEQILRLPKPVIAAVDGAALGAGFGLALASDVVVASHRATFGATAIRHGLVGGATAALLAFRLGGSHAARLLMTGETIDANEAHRVGICTRPVDREQIWVAASEVAKASALAPGEAVQATKRVLNESIGEALLTQLASVAADSATACTTEAAREGISAFVEKRDPDWP